MSSKRVHRSWLQKRSKFGLRCPEFTALVDLEICKNFTRSKPGTSELVAWKYEVDQRKGGPFTEKSTVL